MSSIDKSEKKAKKAAKRKAEEEAAQEAAAAPAVEEPAVELTKEQRKAAKREKRAKQAAETDDDKPAASTSSALSALADDLMGSKPAAAAEEVFDLTALKKNKKSIDAYGSVKNADKMAVHASRAGGDDERAAAAAFQPDENAEVIAEPIRIFLGNLPFKINDDLIHECFDEFGEIVGIHWVTDKASGQFYGTAFVDFATQEAAKGALVRNGVEILGRAIKVNFATGANVNSKNRFNSKEKKGGHLAKLPISEKPEGCNTVFLGNLPFNIDEATIRETFGQCGDISDVRWVEKDGEFKGCGFVEFVESWGTDEAVKLNGSDVMGRPMRVDYSARGSR